MGDFNELLFHHEKNGGKPRLERQLSDFREFIEECDLRDLGYSSNKYTWCYRRAGNQHISERLDRFLVNSIWWNCFPNAKVTHGVVAYSDHSPIWG